MSDDYLPKQFTQFNEAHPKVAEALGVLGATISAQGPLDAKTRHLIKLGIATAIQSQGAVKSHVRQALLAGANRAEIEHAMLLSITTNGFPVAVAALQWAQEVFDARSQ